MSTPISGDNSNNLYISRQMADALKSKQAQALIKDVLGEDGKVDSSDKAKVLELRGLLEQAALADDQTISSEEKSLLNSLDHTGMFGTNSTVVSNNLQRLKAADSEANTLNFEQGVGVTAQDGVSGFFGGKQDRVIRLRPELMPQETPPEGTPADNTQQPQTPALTSPFESENQQAQQQLQQSLTTLGERLQNNDPELLANIRKDAGLELEGQQIAPDSPEYQTKLDELTAQRVEAAKTAIQNYKNDPSSANLSDVWYKLGAETEYTQTSDPSLSKLLRDVQANIKTAQDMNGIAEEPKTNAGLQRYEIPSTVEQINNDIIRTMDAPFNSSQEGQQGNLPNAVQQSRTLYNEMVALQQNNPTEFNQRFGNIGTNGLKEMDTLLTSLEQQVNSYAPETFPKTISELNQLSIFTKQIEAGIKAEPTDSPDLQATKAAYDTLAPNGYSSTLENARYDVKSFLDKTSTYSIELQQAENSLNQLLQTSSELPPATRAALEGQLKAVQQARQALSQGQPIPSDVDTAALETVLKSMDEAKSRVSYNYTPYTPPRFTLGSTGTSSIFTTANTSLVTGNLNIDNPLLNSSLIADANLGLTTGSTDFNLGSITNMGTPRLGSSSGLSGGFNSGNLLGTSSNLSGGFNTNSLFSPTPSFADELGLGFNLTGGINDFSYGGFSGISYTQPKDLSQTLLANTNTNVEAAAKQNLFDELNKVEDPKLKEAITNAQQMMNDPMVSENTKAFVYESLVATQKTLSGAGEEMIGTPGVKASDRAQDLSLLHSLYTHKEPDGQVNPYLNSALLAEAIDKLKGVAVETSNPQMMGPGLSGGTRAETHTNILNTITELSDVEKKALATNSFKSSLDTHKEKLATTSKNLDEANRGLNQIINNKEYEESIKEVLRTSYGYTEGNVAEFITGVNADGTPRMNTEMARQLTEAINKPFQTEYNTLKQLEATGKLTQAQAQQMQRLESNMRGIGQNLAAAADTRNELYTSMQGDINRLTQQMNAPGVTPGVRAFYQSSIDQLEEIRTKVLNGSAKPEDIRQYTITYALNLAAEEIMRGGDESKLPLIQGLINNPPSTPAEFGRRLGDIVGVDVAQRIIGEADRAGGTMVAANNQTIILQNNVDNVIGGNPEALLADPAQSSPTGGQMSPLRVGAGHEDPTTPAADQPTATSRVGQRPLLQPLPSIADDHTEMPPGMFAAASAGLGQMVDEGMSLPPEERSRWMTDVAAPALQQVNQANSNAVQSMQTYVEQMTPINNNLQTLSQERQEILANSAIFASKEAELSQASADAVAEADALAASLDLSPKPTKSGNELTSELISDFLKTIQQLGADTRKLILARMAVQMLDRVIGERYKAQADEANKYHKEALDKMIQSFRDQIETSIKQAEAATNSDGQRLAAMSGEHAGIMGDANIRSKVEEILDRTMDISPPIMTDNQKRDILNQLFDGDPSNDTMGLMGIVNNFELQRRSLMARGVSMN